MFVTEDGADEISGRHRHRYGFYSTFRERVENAGMRITCLSLDGVVEAVEISENDFFLGVQFHPEFKSRPQQAHPLFRQFVNISSKRRK